MKKIFATDIATALDSYETVFIRIPVRVGIIAPPKKRRSQRRTTTTMNVWMKGTGRAQLMANTERTRQRSRLLGAVYPPM